MFATRAMRPGSERSARDRILHTAYELFSHRGVHDVGVDELVERAGVAKATLYKHFPSKDDLVLAFLEQREQIWTYGWVESEARRRAETPEQQLLAIFDLFDEWFHRDDFEGCSFIKVLLEFGDLDHPVGRASANYLENIRSVVENLALEAGLHDPDAFALSWHILMKGSIVQAAEGDRDAAKRAQALGSLLIEQHRNDRTTARVRMGRDGGAVSGLRGEAATARPHGADDRDRAAELRDRGAEGRDQVARLHDLEDDWRASREDIRLRAERDRARAAADRAKAADDRVRAADDRKAAAGERAEALRLQDESVQSLKLAATDELTGARTRKFGLEEVSRELERARRTGAPLLLAFVDIDGLKEVNDSQGHLAGDALLRRVGETLRAHVRAYDLIVRYGGDEFICAMPNLSASEARTRLEQVAAVLTEANPEHSVTFGIAQAEPADTLNELISRADADLLAARHEPRA